MFSAPLGFFGPSSGVILRGLPVPTTLTSGVSTTNAATYDAASVGPAAGRLLVAAVASQQSAIVVPTCAGLGITWVEIDNQPISTTRRITVFAAISDGSSGVVTFDFGGQTQNTAVWWIGQFADADTTSVAAAVVQTTSTEVPSNTTGTTTLGAFEHENNVNLTLVINRKAVANINQDPQFTEIDEIVSTDFVTLEVQWARNEATCTPTWASDVTAIISMEIKAA